MERVAMEDGKDNDREWRRWRMGRMMMSDGKGSDEEWRGLEQREQSWV